MVEEEKEQTSNKKKVILISVAAGLGTLILAGVIWFFIFSSQFAVFTEDTYHISIKYPRSWKVIPGYEGTLVAFISPKEDGLDFFPENLNITVTDLSQKPMTLEEYTQLAIKQMNAVFKNNIEVMESKQTTFAGFPAYLYAVKATETGDLIVKFVWFIKDNEAFYITYAAQMLSYDKYAGKFDEMLNSFSIPAY